MMVRFLADLAEGNKCFSLVATSTANLLDASETESDDESDDDDDDDSQIGLGKMVSYLIDNPNGFKVVASFVCER